MSRYEIRDDPLIAKRSANLRHGQAGANGPIEIQSILMITGSLGLMDGIDNFGNPIHPVIIILSNEVNLVLGVVSKVTDYISILPRKILMYEQEYHSASI
jgi:hypothetical protein